MKTVSELQHLAKRFGWEVGPLTQRKIDRMTSDEVDFHTKLNKAEFDRAIEEPRSKSENLENARLAKVQREFDETATEEETNEALAEVKKFVATHPQFIGNHMPNRETLIGWLKTHKLQTTQPNLTTAFEELGRTGQLVLNPAAVGVIRIKTSNGRTEDICKEDLPAWQRRNGAMRVAGKNIEIPVEILPFEEITGAALVRSTQRDRLLKAYTPTIAAQIAQDKMSAAEYREQNAEAFRQDMPAQVLAKFDAVNATFLSFHPEFERSEESRKHVMAYIVKRNLPYTLNTLETAYGDLVRDGYITPNPNAVVTSRGTKMVDFGPDSRCKQVLNSDSPSLSYEINQMSADQYQKWLQNPANRARVNSAVGSR